MMLKLHWKSEGKRLNVPEGQIVLEHRTPLLHDDFEVIAEVEPRFKLFSLT